MPRVSGTPCQGVVRPQSDISVSVPFIPFFPPGKNPAKTGCRFVMGGARSHEIGEIEMSASKPDGLDWVGSIFKIEGEGDTLILIVQAAAAGLDIQKLQLESNALKRKFETGLFKNLIVDLGDVHYFGSELIGALIRTGRTCTDRRGKVAFCSPSAQMLEVLESMRLNKLWPILPNRAEALTTLHA